MERLRTSISEELAILDVAAEDLFDVFEMAVDRGISHGEIPAESRQTVIDELTSREKLFSTAIGHSVAVPHAYIEGLTDQVVVFVRLKHAINVGAPDGVPTQFVFVLMGPPGKAVEHLDTLTAIARLMSDEEFRYDAREAKGLEDLARALETFTSRTAPTREEAVTETSAGLQYTGRLCGGLIQDMRRRLPVYRSDFTDGLHSKTISSTLFLYFACLAPTVTFGGLMFAATGGQIGVTEMLVATSLCGITYALLGGQPLVILGGTGPLLVFIGVLYSLCVQFDVREHFLSAFAWTGLWTGLFMAILSVTDGSCLIRWFTRFTDEIFAALISIIFISEAVHRIIRWLSDAHLEELSHDVAFLSILLALGTFVTAMLLSRIRTSRYLRPMAREFFADFGPAIALTLMIVFAFTFPGVPLAKLDVPETFSTTTGRSWIIPLFDAPQWIWWATAVPALLATVLVYMDHNITTRLVNSPDHHLHKGEAYHLDQLVIGVLIGICSVLGIPWHVAATVRSLNHVRSLADSEEVVLPGGDTHSQIIHVRETRLTGLLIHLLIACSLFLLPILRTVPEAVLYGLFLYMGVVSIAGNQFFERIMLWGMDPALYPRTHYIRNAPLSKIHLFTLIQLGGLVLLWIVKESAIGILFPLFIALLVPVRIIANRYFTADELRVLDADEEPEEEQSEWV